MGRELRLVIKLVSQEYSFVFVLRNVLNFVSLEKAWFAYLDADQTQACENCVNVDF